MSNEGNIKASILLIVLKFIVVGCSNGNEVSQVGCFQITGRWICYSIFFDISFIVFFTRFCAKGYWEIILFELKFQKFISRCSILLKFSMSNFVILKWRPFEYKVKSWKICPFVELVFQKWKNNDILNFHE